MRFSRSTHHFFGYMMRHYAIDLLCEYNTEEFPGTQKVINPEWRELDRNQRSLKAKLINRNAKYTALTIHADEKDEEVEKWKIKKAKLVEEIEYLEDEVGKTKIQLSEIEKHMDWKDLPLEDKFQRLAPSKKRLLDTVKMIAYRAETAMVGLVRENLKRKDDGRALIQDLLRSDADILPDIENKILNVQVHHKSNPRSDIAIKSLLDNLNETEFNYPGTSLRLVYSFASNKKIPDL